MQLEQMFSRYLLELLIDNCCWIMAIYSDIETGSLSNTFFNRNSKFCIFIQWSLQYWNLIITFFLTFIDTFPFALQTYLQIL